MQDFWIQISAHWPSILLAWGALAVAASTPGPAAMAIMGVSMAHGRSAGMTLTWGVLSGSATWALIASVGVAAWLTSFAYALMVLKLVGAVYLAWMAWKALRSALTPGRANADAAGMAAMPNRRSLFRRGALIHLTNPKAVLGWTATVAISQMGGGGLPVLIFTVAGSLCITTAIHQGYALVFATKTAMTAYRRARRWIEGLLGGVFAFASYKLATS
ncbi:MAG: LysE family translocator [Pseudomonadota bacterium]